MVRTDPPARARKNPVRVAGMDQSIWHLLLVTAPGTAWIVLFVVLPNVYLMGVAFLSNGTYGLPEFPLTLTAFKQLAGFTYFGWSPGNLYTLARSVLQTIISTSVVILLAYPIAFYITTRPSQIRPLMLLAVVVPSWTNQVIRAIGWMNILAPHTVVTEIAAYIGLANPDLGLFPSNFAVNVGLVYNFLPFMVFPLYGAFEKLDYSQVEAARDLYASPFRAFIHSVVPQTLPGLIAGVVLVSIPAFGMYVVPKLLGAGKSIMIGNFVADQFLSGANWPLGAAAALIMIIATLGGLYVLRKMTRRLGGADGEVAL